MGFNSEVGYQTILYCNEVEIRRVLMFLIERLPKESTQVTQIEPTGYVPKTIKQIEASLRESLIKHWLPTEAINLGIRPCVNGYVVSSFGHSCPLKAVDINIPNTVRDREVLEQYSRYIGNVTQQCKDREFVQSILFMEEEFQYTVKQHLSQIQPRDFKEVSKVGEDLILPDIVPPISNSIQDNFEKYNESPDSNNKEFPNQIKQEQELYVVLQKSVKDCEKSLRKIKESKIEEENSFKNSTNKMKLKRKTNAVLSNNDSISKLEKLIENSQEHFAKLSNQWEQIKLPLIEEHRALTDSVGSKTLRSQNDQIKLQNCRKKYSEIMMEFKEKAILEKSLVEKYKSLDTKNNRAAYTRRILEIVGNIKKQNDEIQRVLKDTRQIQKQINNLSGQIDRSFTLADELIYQDAKQGEVAKTAYKLLVSLRNEFLSILTAVSDLGQAERELRNLEEQVELEKSKEVKFKLEKVNHDLLEIKKDINLLL
ncbi:coiled-coil domain-containing protein 22 homolog isoform X2 [Cylas formicarius]|nr:coiled-coil domain-containing protein 22 homolog isoform X2 [Cylas formicarius]